MKIKWENHYNNRLCPDCKEKIPDNADNGSECLNCGHIFYTID